MTDKKKEKKEKKEKKTVNREPTECIVQRVVSSDAPVANVLPVWADEAVVGGKAEAQKHIETNKITGRVRIVRVLYDGTPEHKVTETVKTLW